MHISAMYCASTNTLSCSHSQESFHCAYVCACVRERDGEKVSECACTQGGRSWLKFINFLLANEAPCAFFLLTNGTD